MSLKGRLLVATPVLYDSNFDRSVVLVLEHGGDGAVGVIVNRPSATPLAEALPEWSARVAEPGVVFLGGPVALDSAIAVGLATATIFGTAPAGPFDAVGWEPVAGNVGIVDLSGDPELVLAGLSALRVFVGYAGWSAGQLEAEVEAGAWVVVDSRPGDAVTAEPDDLWEAVLRREGGSTAWLVNFPDDPSMN